MMVSNVVIAGLEAKGIKSMAQLPRDKMKQGTTPMYTINGVLVDEASLAAQDIKERFVKRARVRHQMCFSLRSLR